MKTLKYKKIAGLKIYCNQCKKTLNKGNNKLGGCNHPIEKQVYKAVYNIPNGGGKRKSKVLTSRVLDKAIVECLEFKASLSSPNEKLELKQKLYLK